MRNAISSPAGAPARPSFFRNFLEFSSYLDTIDLFRIRPGLERMRSVLERLGLKRPPFAVVQVVGTNGKGSTCVMLERLARAHGLSTGLHVSPHFVSVRERILLDGNMLPESEWTALANALMEHGGAELSYFEFVTCLSVLAFSRAKVAVAIMETGLGGAFDATTAMDADLVVFTPIDLDHQGILGSSLQEIARDKAGSIRRGKGVISAPQQAEAEREIMRVAQERGAPLRFAAETGSLPGGPAATPRPMRLRGAHQAGNARLALAAWRWLRRDAALPAGAQEAIAAATRGQPRPETEIAALAAAWLPGRMQYVAPLRGESAEKGFPSGLGWPHMLLDGAHNRHGLAALGSSLAKEGIAPAAVIFSCLADKNPEHMIPHLRALATGPIFVPPIAGNPRAMTPEELAALIGVNAVPKASLAEALAGACAHMAERLPEAFAGGQSKNPLLICGSLYLLGECFALRPDCLAEPVHCPAGAFPV